MNQNIKYYYDLYLATIAILCYATGFVKRFLFYFEISVLHPVSARLCCLFRPSLANLYQP